MSRGCSVGQPHHRVDLGGLQGLPPGHIGQDGGQARGQHGLARARRAHHGQIVPAGGGDLQARLACSWPFTSAKSGGPREPGVQGLGGGEGASPPQVGHQLAHILHRVDRQPPARVASAAEGAGT